MSSVGSRFAFLLDNPVVTKELRGRMRGTRTPWLLFGYLLLLSLILFFSYLGWWNSHSDAMQTGGGGAGFTVGRNFFKILFYSQAVMIALITPALTAGAISVEREQRTFEMLRGTILRPSAIVWGKLVSSVSFVALLLTSSLPLVSLCFLLGGVSPGEVFFAYLLLLGDAFLFGAIGLCWSAYAANTATATVLSYATLIAFFVVTFPFALPVLDESPYSKSVGLCAVNPVGAVLGAVVPEHYYGWTWPAWVAALLLNGTLSALLVLACVNRLEDFPTRRAAALRGTTLLFAGLLTFFGGGMALGLPLTVGMTFTTQMLLLLAIPCLLLLVFVPVLVTGEADEEEPAPKFRWWTPHRVFGRATLPSGLPLALLLTALVFGLAFLAPHLGGARQVRGLSPYNYNQAPYNQAPTPATTGPNVGDLLLQVFVMMTLVVFGLAGLGALLSTLLRNRWAALTLLYLAVVLAVAMPFFSYATLYGQDALNARQSFGVNSLYLCPMVPLMQLTVALDSGSSFPNETAIPGMIGYGAWPLWLGTGLIYGAAGVLGYGIAAALTRRRASAPIKAVTQTA